MGQLIKLQDYVSRYQQDIFVYPSRFVRLKNSSGINGIKHGNQMIHSILNPGSKIQPAQRSGLRKKKNRSWKS